MERVKDETGEVTHYMAGTSCCSGRTAGKPQHQCWWGRAKPTMQESSPGGLHVSPALITLTSLTWGMFSPTHTPAALSQRLYLSSGL